MKNKMALLFLFLGFAGVFSWTQEIRKPVFAGAFYDRDKGRLASQIEFFFQNITTSPTPRKDVTALIVPHAGYIYSGQTAASAYNLVRGKGFESVIIVGPSHQYGFEGCSIYPRGGFETPLGVAPIDEALAAEISKASGFPFIKAAHLQEHSVEVQVPFIQTALPQAKIVPIVMGYPAKKTIERLAEALAKVLPSKKILAVASTDMSHYLPKKEANEADAETISLINDLKADALIRKIGQGENILCGGGGVAAVLLALQKRGAPRVEILGYADSSQAGGPEDQVVGYVAAALTLNGSSTAAPQEFDLSDQAKKELLKIARSAISKFILENKILEYETQNAHFLTKKGAFVTLKKEGMLRGCIGFIEPVLPLNQTIIQTAIYAACRDPRFPPVAKEEINVLEIEISVLSPLQKIDDPKLVQVGKHGLVISMGENKGLLLPQVATENRWSRETFLDEACVKAGLPRNAWKKGAEIFIFEAVVFGE